MSRVKTRNHYIEYKYPTYIQVEKIEHRDPSKINIRMDAEAFRFFDRNLTVSNGIVTEGDKSRISCWYYIGKRLHVHDIFRLKENAQNKEAKKRYDDIDYEMDKRCTPYVCDSPKGEIIYLKPEDRVLDDFMNDKINEQQAIEMFKNIKKNIGNEIEYTLLLNGRVITRNGILTGIEFFSHIEFEDLIIPFVSNQVAIMNIKCGDFELFKNKYIDERSYLVRENIRKAQADLYGYNVSNKKKYRAVRNKKREEELNKKAKESSWEISQSIGTCVEFGKLWDFSFYVLSCCENHRTCELLKIAIICMKELEKGKSHITLNYLLHKYKLCEEDRKMVIGTVLYFSESADRIREFYVSEQIEFNAKTLKLHLKNSFF